MDVSDLSCWVCAQEWCAGHGMSFTVIDAAKVNTAFNRVLVARDIATYFIATVLSGVVVCHWAFICISPMTIDVTSWVFGHLDNHLLFCDISAYNSLKLFFGLSLFIHSSSCFILNNSPFPDLGRTNI